MIVLYATSPSRPKVNSPATTATTNNRLCANCEDNQSRKVDLLRQFDGGDSLPEDLFAAAADAYAAQLDRQFDLCIDCEQLVARVLHTRSRLIMTSALGNLLDQSKRLVRSGEVR